jgi:starvation-inducible DNA-binding protein
MMKASPTLASNLQMVLTDLIELHVQGKQAHWNLVGANFRDLHLQLDEIIAAARKFADEAAERMRSLHALPDGRSKTVSSEQTARDVHDEVDEEDPTSADLLHAIIERLEQLAWMVNAETMSPSAAVTEPAEK